MHAPFAFVPATDPRPRAGNGLWFVFRGDALLVNDAIRVPRVSTPAELGLAPLRTQYLGRLGELDCFSAELPAAAEPPAGYQFQPMRALFRHLPDTLRTVVARAVQIVQWDRGHQFCGACGSPTEFHPSRHSRVCPRCEAEFYPRVAPAMIVAVERGEEILLARSPHFPAGIYSVLAGFVEPGESVEDAVHREVFEEVGLRIRNVRYFTSQAWPFPHSLMLGFQAEYDSGELVLQPEEIEDAGFYHVDRLPTTFANKASISQWLLRDFLRRHGRETD